MSLTSWGVCVCVCEQDAKGAALALGGELTFSPHPPPSISSISGIQTKLCKSMHQHVKVDVHTQTQLGKTLPVILEQASKLSECHLLQSDPYSFLHSFIGFGEEAG